MLTGRELKLCEDIELGFINISPNDRLILIKKLHQSLIIAEKNIIKSRDLMELALTETDSSIIDLKDFCEFLSETIGDREKETTSKYLNQSEFF